ncbi:hypothetical protein SAMN05428988_3244 [Chitinophaga sp. YR573]|uniref:hypothetical protein n=1 Tax=Chitinophaga sp. YR573 TaxID=1881040 RepID=UPI0008C757DD|nr:hypothetical protein [Chitinophaga sp. YR573]SEW21740.1 hypothetical protein SAMN05428988_3244 [Chitinophaga sp. YR573]
MIVGKSTNTTLFLVPGLSINVEDVKSKYGFINGFLKETGKDAPCKYPVYLLFMPPEFESFQEFVDKEYKDNTGILADYDYAGGFVVLVYKFPTSFERVYRRFIKGEYSKFSPEYVPLLPAYEKSPDGSNVVNMSLQLMVIFKVPAFIATMEEIVDDVLADECWSIPDIKRETLNIESIRKKLNKQ